MMATPNVDDNDDDLLTVRLTGSSSSINTAEEKIVRGDMPMVIERTMGAAL